MVFHGPDHDDDIDDVMSLPTRKDILAKRDSRVQYESSSARDTIKRCFSVALHNAFKNDKPFPLSVGISKEILAKAGVDYVNSILKELKDGGHTVIQEHTYRNESLQTFTFTEVVEHQNG